MKYLRRLVWFIATRLLVLTAVLGLMTIAFYFSMNAANIYIILKDGMAQRAQTVMMGESPGELEKYFARSYIERDNVLSSIRTKTNPYERFRITGFDHRLNMEWMWSWPWDDTARATITERIPAIDGRILAEYRQVTPQAQWAVPRWESARYNVVLARENGQWHIKNMTYVGPYEPGS
ncbi:MAG: hypothetical protein GX650_07670 [Clostridiales bacterium]|nr:hypothetical protein [Clostridiales bacterium]